MTREKTQPIIYAVFDRTNGELVCITSWLGAARSMVMERNAASGADDRFAVFERASDHDRRIARGDDFSGDAWRHLDTGEIRWTAVGRLCS